MREILFKAKRLDNGEWITGCYALMHGYHYIMPEDDYSIWYEVNPETICQYTGLTDKNGNKIWENDILKFEWDKKKIVDVIKYDPPMFTYSNSMRWNLQKDEVIGNIFDNPELMERMG